MIVVAELQMMSTKSTLMALQYFSYFIKENLFKYGSRDNGWPMVTLKH